MNVGVCKLTLRLPENQDLKGKRRVVKSLCDRIRFKFNVTIAEVDNNDKWQVATLGIACVSNSNRQVAQALDQVIFYIEESRVDLEMVECEVEALSGF
ncbi:MAG: hypothetical protein BZY67_00750 [SAR202 cluster bacterium Io17-Chloro-G1]|nr:hypothetical protein [Dehalococcoidia bacterium]PKB63289.1 MAG: hypothetical protein BZY67_00750 [SAR202 cluster bacterium Io17-Chloro-G1]